MKGKWSESIKQLKKDLQNIKKETKKETNNNTQKGKR